MRGVFVQLFMLVALLVAIVHFAPDAGGGEVIAMSQACAPAVEDCETSERVLLKCPPPRVVTVPGDVGWVTALALALLAFILGLTLPWLWPNPPKDLTKSGVNPLLDPIIKGRVDEAKKHGLTVAADLLDELGKLVKDAVRARVPPP
jgi:hypothetical protein